MTISPDDYTSIGGETDWDIDDLIKAILGKVDIIDEHDFADDMAYLQSLSDFMIEVGLPQSGHMYFAVGDTVHDQTVSSLSPAARRAIFGEWPA